MPSTPPNEPPYERLDAWRASHELALVTSRASRKWPSPDHAGLSDQLRVACCRAAVNLMEGTARAVPRERERCVRSALSAIAEVEYLLLLARDVGIIDTEEWQLLNGFATRAGQLTGGLYRALRRRKQSPLSGSERVGDCESSTPRDPHLAPAKKRSGGSGRPL
ncbi:MAG: four helix bundle protein [Gemmatimonadales bacterium]